MGRAWGNSISSHVIRMFHFPAVLRELHASPFPLTSAFSIERLLPDPLYLPYRKGGAVHRAAVLQSFGVFSVAGFARIRTDQNRRRLQSGDSSYVIAGFY